MNPGDDYLSILRKTRGEIEMLLPSDIPKKLATPNFTYNPRDKIVSPSVYGNCPGLKKKVVLSFVEALAIYLDRNSLLPNLKDQELSQIIRSEIPSSKGYLSTIWEKAMKCDLSVKKIIEDTEALLEGMEEIQGISDLGPR